MKDFNTENAKARMEKIWEDIKKVERHFISWIGITNTVKMSIQPKAICRFDIIPIKIPVAYFKQLERIILSPSSQSYGFSSSHVWMWEFDYKESWALKNWCFWTVVLEKTLESPLDWREIRSVNPKGNQSWIFIGRMDAEAETPILWPPDAKNWLTEKDPAAGKDWRQEEKGMTED